MRTLILIFITIGLFSCAYSPIGQNKSFDIETGKEVRPVSTFHEGKSNCKVVNNSERSISLVSGDIDIIVLPNSFYDFTLTAKDSIVVNGVIVDYEVLGKHDYVWTYNQ